MGGEKKSTVAKGSRKEKEEDECANSTLLQNEGSPVFLVFCKIHQQGVGAWRRSGTPMYWYLCSATKMLHVL